MIQETPEEKFEKELMRRGLADRTIKEYMKCWRRIPKDVPLTEQVLYNFLDVSAGSIPRAFVKIYAQVHKLKDFTPPRQSGRKAVRLPKIMPEEEYEKLRHALYNRNGRWGLMIDISYWCGMRRGEVVDLKVDNFLFDEWKGEGYPCRIKFIGKGNKERIAVIPGWLIPTINNFIMFRAEQGMRSDGYIFGKENGAPITRDWWGEVFTEVCKRVLGKSYSTHHLRHTRTFLWRRAGIPIDQVAKRLGHSSIATTQSYWNLDIEEVASDWEKEVS